MRKETTPPPQNKSGLQYAIDHNIEFEIKSFVSKGVKWIYHVFDIKEGFPVPDYGTPGDIARVGNNIWVRYPTEWKQALLEVDCRHRPMQGHPLLLADRRLHLESLIWNSQSHWNVKGVQTALKKRGKKAERISSELEGCAFPDAPLQAPAEPPTGEPGPSQETQAHVTTDSRIPGQVPRNNIYQQATLMGPGLAEKRTASMRSPSINRPNKSRRTEFPTGSLAMLRDGSSNPTPPHPIPNTSVGDSAAMTPQPPAIAAPTTTMPLPIINPPSIRNSENAWIAKIYQQWVKFPISNIDGIQSIGIHIFEELLRRPEKLSSVPDGSGVRILGEPVSGSSIRPTLQLVMRDIFAMDKKMFNVSDCSTRQSETGLDPSQFVASLVDVFSPEPWSLTRRIYNAVEIIASCKNGIRICDMRPSPYEDDRSWMFQTRSNSTEYTWATTLSPPGSITHTHMDYAGSSQYMIHFYGQKLWLFWPPTENNLAWYGSRHLQIKPETFTLESINCLEGLQLYHLDCVESAFYVPPNYLHAVITISTSAHSGLRSWSLSHFMESKRIMQWFMKFAANYTRHGLTIQEADQMHEDLAEELNWWCSLAERLEGEGGSGELKQELENLMQEHGKLGITVSKKSGKSKIPRRKRQT